MKILITGANGSVGSDLVYFFSKSFFVYGVYRRLNSVNKRLKSKNIKWIKCNLDQRVNFDVNPDIIIHCAVTHEFKKEKNFEDYISSNILTTQNLIKFFSNKKKIKFFNFSTYAVYNRDEKNILSITKTISEHLLTKSNMNYLNIRLPGVLSYINQDIRRPWLNNLIYKLKKNKKINIFNKNKSFDLVVDTYEIFRFIEFLLDKKSLLKKTVNLQSNKPITLFKMVNFLKDKLKSKSKIKFFKKKIAKRVLSQKSFRKFNFKVASSKEIIERYVSINL